MDDESRRREIARLDYEFFKGEISERLKFQVEFAHAVLRGLTLTNGGAIVALFTFIGNSGADFDRQLIWWAFGLFSLGLVLTLVSSTGAFFSQSFYMKSTVSQLWNAQVDMLGGKGEFDYKTEYRKGEWSEAIGIAAGLLAIGLFIVGAGFALAGVL